ncbi:MAG TPA: PRD domain-containing protein [Candidatus Merdisoma merdipullorum]|nr:PRD domain-containing protein [Candidatus Merdisoma merdipullorum]
MRVVKVLNNSLVLALDDAGQETILMGKGIGYHKSIGYQFQESEIEKVFVLKDKAVSRNIIRLAAETDAVYFELAKSVIDYAIDNFEMKLMDHIYLSLTDHLAFAARRIRDGIVLQNFYTLEMKKFNPNEFQVGEYAVSLMSEKLGMEVPMDEAGNIAFHFINAQYNHPYNSQNLLIASTVNDILDIVKYSFSITYNEDSTPYSRYVTHVQLFVQRLVSRNQLPDEKSNLLYEQIASVCQKEFECVEKIQIYVTDKFHQKLTSQERMYLALHIHRVLEEQ